MSQNSSHHVELRQIVDNYCRCKVGSTTCIEVGDPLGYGEALVDPAAGEAGCYAIYAADGRLRYIRMSESMIRNRLRIAFREKTQEDDFWRHAQAKSTSLIKIEASEVPLLEAYLNFYTKDLRGETWDYARKKPDNLKTQTVVISERL